jgi:hypothetical protein
MKPSELLSLDRLSGSPMVEVREQDPKLFALMSAKAAAERKAAVAAAFTGVSKALRVALADVDYSPTKGPERPLRKVIFDSLEAQQVSAAVAEEAVTRVLELEQSAALVDPASLTTIVRDHPLFQDELQQAGVVKVALAASLDLEQAEKMVPAISDPDMVDDGTIRGLVKDKTVTGRQAADLGMAATLFRLGDDRADVAEGLRRGLANTTTINHLAGLGADGWLRAIRRGEVTPPGEQTPTEFADRLDRTVSGLFPTDALMARVLRDTTAKQIQTLIDAGNQQRLTEIANVHPGLGIRAILASNRPPAEKAASIAANIDLIRQVHARNPTVELLTLDYTPESEDVAEVDFGTMSAQDKKLVIADLKAYQRAFALTDDITDAHRLLRAGYHSAVEVGTSTLEAFRTRSGFSERLAERYHAAGRAGIARLTTGVISLVDVLRGGFDEIGAGNIAPSIADYLRKLDGFEDLFGSQDYCACAHCQSILSPAAYFVDLMSFVEERVSKVHFAGAKATDPLHLEVRRPDLWALPLTCENTNTLIPSLDVINEILENHLAGRLGFGGDLGNRAAVEDFVYRQHLASAVDSFNQPFTLPLAKLTSYLAHFERSRADVAEALAAPDATRIAAALDLAARERDLISQPNTNMNFLQRVYGLTFSVSGGVVAPVDVQDLLAATGLTRDELGHLAAAVFVTANGANPIEIRTTKRSPSSVQNDVERVNGLRAASLDRLHRFTRLNRGINRVLAGSPTGPGQPMWSIPEADLVVQQLTAAGVPAGLGAPMLAAIVDVLGLQRRFAVTVEQNCALWGPIPRTALSGKAGSLFDRLFNLPTFVRLDGSLPKDAVSFVHPSLRTPGVPAPADNTLHRLLAALGVADDQLAALITRLAGPLGADLTAPDEDDRGFPLTAANLTLLYRHARLAQLLRVPVADLFALLALAGLNQVANLADLGRLLALADWRADSGYSLDDLALITHGTVARPAAYPDAAELAATIVDRIAADKDLEFADTVFAFVPGVTEDQSRALVAANAARFETTAAGGLRLVATFNPGTPLTVPPGVSVAEPDLRAALLTHHAGAVLPPRLAAQLSLAADRVSPLIAMTGVGPGTAPLVRALHGGPIAPLVDLTDKLIPLTVLFRHEAYDAGALGFLRAHGAVFGIANYNAVSLAGVRKLSVYGALAAASIASDFTPLAPPLDPADVRHVFDTFDPAQGFANTDKSRLAATLRTEPALIATLLPHLDLPADAAEAVDMLRRCVALTTYLGVDGDVLARILSETYVDLNRAGEAILSVFRAKYPDEKEFTEKLEPFEDWVRGRRRDGLTDHLVRSVDPGFDDLDAIYEYLLVDPQLEGCARTSRVVAAISSVQLYVHRVLMNLEQDRRDPGSPQRTAVPPAAIPADEWIWRKNYRVWEANRKVFLWPENYIEPELRDDKTPLFAELESTLLQQAIDEQNVLDAYSGYLSGLEEVAKLQIAGAYHQKDDDGRTDVLHLFGVTPGDPPTYYYRTILNAHFGEQSSGRGVSYGPWQKIDVQIPVRKVAPIVYLGRLFVFWVEIVTTSKNEVKDAASTFVGYKHRLAVRYTTLRLDGGWTPPQSVSLSGGAFSTGDGIVEDPLAEQAERDALQDAFFPLDLDALTAAFTALRTPRYDSKPHSEPIDGYTVQGFQWDRVYPQTGLGELRITGRNFGMRAGVDFYRKAIVPRSQINIHFRKGNLLSSRLEGTFHRLYVGWPSFFVIDDYAQASIVADQRRINALAQVRESAWLSGLVGGGLFKAPLAWLLTPPDTTVVNGSIADALIDLNGDLLYVQGSVRPGVTHVARRLGTTLGERMTRQLFSLGVDGLLATRTQLALKEDMPLLLPEPQLDNAVVSGRIDYRGAFGTYVREVFFHIPFLIANHLNSQQNFAAAQRWYQYIFDPTAAETIHVPDGTPPAERAKRERDRVWRYPEFRRLDLPTLRDVLTDPAAIEAYKKDPFNPHAIARLRLSAYQKCIVMRYIDNLLDWGDSLFNRFTMESVNEATLLYVTAGQILGRRPARLGSCGEATVTPRTYETIAPLVAKGSEFLIELENVIWARTRARRVYGKVKPSFTFAFDRPSLTYFADRAAIADAPPEPPVPELDLTAVTAPATAGPAEVATLNQTVLAFNAAAPAPLAGDQALAHTLDWNRAHISTWTEAAGRAGERLIDAARPLVENFERVPQFGWSLIRQLTPVFCVPNNPELLGYWDRVEDRLFKIRHCLDISGVPRQLALFAPEIDPRLLVRAAAAGLSIEDVLGATSGDLPPYRFQYLIEKARQHAALVQSFGSALLSALEKKDAEELNRLRTVHQQNLLKLTTRVREWEIGIAEDQLETLNRQSAAVQYRLDYYRGLLDTDLIAWERTQQVSRHAASVLSGAAALVDTLAGVSHLLPQLGSPFAMKYGGLELGSSATSWAGVAKDAASVAEAVSASAGLEAGFERRRDGWEHQAELAEHELKALAKQTTAAELRREIATRSLELHAKQIDQLEEIFDLYGSRFSNLALYTFLATMLQRLYREAYNSAYATARLAEQAYRFERGDETTQLLRGNYFDAGRAGLLAGEQLQIDLETMERRFIETNYRQPELDQSFSLSQIDPAALVRLRETGECTFEIPEVFFDLFYPGHYRRRLKSVRLTMPCVTGPYTNVGATLTLTGSKIRRQPQLGAAGLVDVPVRRSAAIATSTAQNDAGVFEFTFRDERYMPFEGAGAVSTWRLTLPRSFRPFEYQTLTDVIMHVSYTADADELFRGQVEQLNAAIDGTILNYLSSNAIGRAFSFRQDFSTVFNRLLHSAAGTPVPFDLTDRHLPLFLRGRPLTVAGAKLLLRTAAGQSITGVRLRLDSANLTAFSRDAELGNLFAADAAVVFAGGLLGAHTLTVVAAGNLAPSPPEPADPSAIDEEKLLDVYLYLELTTT